MSVTLSVERYDKMQTRILELEERVKAEDEGKVYLGNSYFMGKAFKTLWLPSEVVELLDKDLIEQVKRLEVMKTPEVAKKKFNWWWRA
jgi:hypothetical protein